MVAVDRNEYLSIAKKLLRLGEIRNKVENMWSTLDYKEEKERIISSPPLNLLNQHINTQ